MRLIVGLGNPGRRYARTRHNVGFRVIDRLCERRGVGEPDKRQLEALITLAGSGDDKIALIKPQTYMNLSGRSVRSLAGYYKVEPDEVLVVCDDLALPLGKLRLRRSGSSGGQKGIQSIIEAFGANAFPRLRIGIGAAPEVMDAADYVLSRFTEAEEDAVRAAVERACDCVDTWLQEGVEAAMNRFNVSTEA